MIDSATSAEQLSAALLEIEDRSLWNAEADLALTTELEARAVELGDDTLVARARLCRTHLLARAGDIAEAARRLDDSMVWAVEHGDRLMQARIHVIWSYVQRLRGDFAKSLEHALSSVELLDGTATPQMRVRHHMKLADALADSGALDAARPRFRQTEELARELGLWEPLTNVLNNWAYSEYLAGDFVRAQEVASRLQEHAEAHGIELATFTLDTIGAIQIGNGQYAEAEQTMLACIELHHTGRYDGAEYLAEYLLTLARAQRGMGATDRAQVNLDASRAVCAERELHEVMVRVHQEQAELHAARGEIHEAFATHKIFHEAYERLRSKQHEAQAQTIFETVEVREEAERFREQARRDALTGLRNRRYIDEELPALIAANPDLTVAIVDLDHFKRINDELSHDVGDQVLVRIAKLLESELLAATPDGFVARLGGEEFLMVLPTTAVAAATDHLDRIRKTVSAYPWPEITGTLPVTISIGVAGVHEASDRSQPALLSTADRNLYIAKHAGRDRVASSQPGKARTYRDLDAA
ncbi:GGDEF domain-containing protein [Krasilnikovia cinnamomea]|uniref:GGDEF domain-containing protein n=1 Tax=Krasilnikovia cinnamomea TaxID=349313 RepID=UPI001F5E3C01|nr:GGDEF domain-containing protein [Krasilnikovia cinnamomea]